MQLQPVSQRLKEKDTIKLMQFNMGFGFPMIYIYIHHQAQGIFLDQAPWQFYSTNLDIKPGF